MNEPRVLLVDDERFFLNLQQEFLADSPVRVITAQNGREALDMVRRNRPGIVYLDLRMPELDGAACCSAIKNEPDLRDTPVVMVVSEGKPRDREVCLDAGCNGIISKPLDRIQFLSVGRRLFPAIERRQPRYPFSALAFFRIRDTSFHGTIADISLGGAYIACRCDLAAKEDIRLGFILGNTSVVECRARVAWTNQGGMRPRKSLPDGFGVQFQSMEPPHQEVVRQLVARLG
ncbi:MULTISPECIES: response regulator [Geobacter]|uniref:response regulator n=1 Tax=Geobacter TaxID=28231 RepID=UPI002572428F|nr:response regulator [Geobacter sulfurreducens]BEH11773.1 response regulator [Geobacter sulfurreducens subsp. ethanolicus]BET59633.1 response regulator [Geobacter sp. 60473]HML77070.1 response regulator [Geobacter sulfurreducens]